MTMRMMAGKAANVCNVLSSKKKNFQKLLVMLSESMRCFFFLY